MRTVQELAFCFNYSSKKLLQFQESYENNQKRKFAMEKESN